MKKNPSVIVTCEHASAHVPSELKSLFSNAEAVLTTHQAWDPGALAAALDWSAFKGSPIFSGEITRLVCDLNRSASNRDLWSSWTRDLPASEKQKLLSRWYFPYRQAVELTVASLARQEIPVLHISVHSFTPVLDGNVRDVDIGILYDPGRANEKTLAREVCSELQPDADGQKVSKAKKTKKAAPLRIRRNAPYSGKSDSFTCFFRKLYPDELYAGFEIEFNQALLERGPFPARRVAMAFDAALRRIVNGSATTA